MGIIEGRSFEAFKYGDKPPAWARGNAYLQPNSLGRALVLGGIESFKCPDGELKYAEDALKPGESHEDKLAPCFEAVPSLYDGPSSRTRAGAWPRCATRRAASPGRRRPPTPTRATETRDNPAMPFLFGKAYERLGKRYFWLYVAFEFVSAFIVCLATVGLFALYTDPSSSEFWTIAAFAEVCVLFSTGFMLWGGASGSGRSSIGWRATATRSRPGAPPSRYRAS